LSLFRSRLRAGRLHAVAIGLALLLACASPSQDPPEQDPASESEALREHVEQVRDDPSFDISGVRIAARRLIPELYARRGFTRAWTVPAAREDLLRAIRESAADGLDPEDYLYSTLERVRAEAEAEPASLDAQVHYELLLSEALIRLFYHVIFGKVDPKSFDPNWSFTRRVHLEDPASFVQEAIDSGELFARIEREKPQHDFYRRLKAELARHRDLATRGGWPELPADATWKLGSGKSASGLRARLVASGDLAVDAPQGPPEVDAAVEAAVKRFQTNHGLDADGAVGLSTLAALNVPTEARIEEIRVNLERGRWLLHDLEPSFLIVNVAGFEVYYLRDQMVAWSARAVVGRPYRKTPIFRSTMTYLVFNPTWTVPPSILAHDILPAQRRDRSTLAKKGLKVIDHTGRAVPEASIDWATATPRNFRYLLRQAPGPENALGRVKFMFPNPYSVYLHDTPSKALFERSERAFSSGCIRVENPFELAVLLLEGQPGWDREAIDRAVASGETKSVTLARPVPVLVTYWTAWVDRDGVLQLRTDIYGRDAHVAAGLDAGFRFRVPRS